MRIDALIDKLTKLQKLYPEAMLYFTDEMRGKTWETYFEDCYVDEETNEIELKFCTYFSPSL